MSPTCPASLAAITSPPITAPLRSRRPPGTGDPPAVATRQPARQPRDPHGCDHPDPAPAQRGSRVLRQEAGRGKDSQGSARAASSARSATPSSPASGSTPARPQSSPGQGSGEGTPGTTLHPARPADTPYASSSDKPLPDPAPAYDLAPLRAHRRSRFRGKPGQPLDTESKEDSFCTPAVTRCYSIDGAQIRPFCRRASLLHSGVARQVGATAGGSRRRPAWPGRLGHRWC